MSRIKAVLESINAHYDFNIEIKEGYAFLQSKDYGGKSFVIKQVYGVGVRFLIVEDDYSFSGNDIDWSGDFAEGVADLSELKSILKLD